MRAVRPDGVEETDQQLGEGGVDDALDEDQAQRERELLLPGAVAVLPPRDALLQDAVVEVAGEDAQEADGQAEALGQREAAPVRSHGGGAAAQRRGHVQGHIAQRGRRRRRSGRPHTPTLRPAAAQDPPGPASPALRAAGPAARPGEGERRETPSKTQICSMGRKILKYKVLQNII